MRATDKQRGFTLLEIMVVIVIIGVLASLVVPNLMGNKEKADKQKAVSDIVALENALDMYKLDNHHYPTTNQGLESLVEAPTLPPLAANYNKEGYIKRLPIDTYRTQNRGGKGVKCYKITDKSGTVVGFKAVNDDNEIMLITNQGIVIRLLCKDISILGRITTGVKLINMDLESDITVASIAKVRQKSADESESLEMMEREMNEADNEEGNVEEPESPEDK